jgi:hypothetical protein
MRGEAGALQCHLTAPVKKNAIWDSGEHDGPEIGSAGLAPSGPVAPRSGRQGRRPRAPSCAYGEYVPASVHMCRCSYSTSDFNIHCRVLTSAHPMQAAWQPMHAWRGAGGPAPDPACCLCLADGWLLVARASGALLRFSLPGRELAGAGLARCV